MCVFQTKTEEQKEEGRGRGKGKDTGALGVREGDRGSRSRILTSDKTLSVYLHYEFII